jgi:hypothetical protein
LAKQHKLEKRNKTIKHNNQKENTKSNVNKAAKDAYERKKAQFLIFNKKNLLGIW